MFFPIQIGNILVGKQEKIIILINFILTYSNIKKRKSNLYILIYKSFKEYFLIYRRGEIIQQNYIEQYQVVMKRVLSYMKSRAD